MSLFRPLEAERSRGLSIESAMMWFFRRAALPFVPAALACGCGVWTATPATVPAPPPVVLKPIQALPIQALADEERAEGESLSGNGAVVDGEDRGPVDPRQILFADAFDDAMGGATGIVDGAWIPSPRMTRAIRPFALHNGGVLTILAVEDASLVGPDNRPGVLALRWRAVPMSLEYSGLVYEGRTNDRLIVPKLSAATSQVDLQGITVRFRYKAINETPTSEGQEPKPVEVWFRLGLEPIGMNDDVHRIGLGRFKATREWQTLVCDLGQGENVLSFVEAILTQQTTHFKLVWSQVAKTDPLREGDMLLIDDIEIRDRPAPLDLKSGKNLESAE